MQTYTKILSTLGLSLALTACGADDSNPHSASTAADTPVSAAEKSRIAALSTQNCQNTPLTGTFTAEKQQTFEDDILVVSPNCLVEAAHAGATGYINSPIDAGRQGIVTIVWVRVNHPTSDMKVGSFRCGYTIGATTSLLTYTCSEL